MNRKLSKTEIWPEDILTLCIGDPNPLCMSEKSKLLSGNGTIPGSENTALRWDIISKNTMVLKHTTLNAPHKLKKKRKDRYIVNSGFYTIFKSEVWSNRRKYSNIINIQSVSLLMQEKNA